MARQLYVASHEGDARRAQGIVRLCVRATEIDSNYARAWALLALGQVILRFLHGGKFDTGMAAAEQALALDPTLAEAHAVKARVYSEDGRYGAASAEIDAALRLDPDSYEVNRSAAYLRYRQKRPGDAALYFEKAMTLLDTDVNSASMLLDPDNIKSRYNCACTLASRLKEPDAALELLEPIFENISVGLLNHAKADPDLDSLRNDPRFTAMAKAADARLAAMGERC
jgi:tetratricopeptide (TPR) repeat protein